MKVIGVFGRTRFRKEELAKMTEGERNAAKARMKELEAMAETLGGEASSGGVNIVLTGGDKPGESGVKNMALKRPNDAGHRWIGVTQGEEKNDPDDSKAGRLVLRTSLDDRRNYLEACLVDAALVLPGGAGTLSEAVATLCLKKPVVFIGDDWDLSGVSEVLRKINRKEPISHGEWQTWIYHALGRLFDIDNEGERISDGEWEKRIEAAVEQRRKQNGGIDKLISDALLVGNLTDAHNHNYIGVVPSNQANSAMAVLAQYLPASIPHAFPDLGLDYEKLKLAYDKFV